MTIFIGRERNSLMSPGLGLGKLVQACTTYLAGSTILEGLKKPTSYIPSWLSLDLMSLSVRPTPTQSRTDPSGSQRTFKVSWPKRSVPLALACPRVPKKQSTLSTVPWNPTLATVFVIFCHHQVRKLLVLYKLSCL